VLVHRQVGASDLILEFTQRVIHLPMGALLRASFYFLDLGAHIGFTSPLELLHLVAHLILNVLLLVRKDELTLLVPCLF